MNETYLKGINSLRFFAAFLVILSHAFQTAAKFGFAPQTGLMLFRRGEEAVDFFFTLSGFLITYLLISESKKYGSISIKQFYLRRVLRIFPLYFLILGVGFVVLGVIVPRITGEQYFDFDSPLQGFLLYLFFLPNVASAFYKVGLLFPLWSIGVEEQFYLFWAPLAKIFRNNIWLLSLMVFAGSGIFSLLTQLNIFNVDDKYQVLFVTLRFHCMAIGGGFAYLLHYRPRLLLDTFLGGKLFQAFCLAVILYNAVFKIDFVYDIVDDTVMSVFYSLLIINTAVNPRRLINFEQKALLFLGTISYGLYMYHMTVDYFLRIVMTRMLSSYSLQSPIYFWVYLFVLTLTTIIIASLSYKFFELRFLWLKNKIDLKEPTPTTIAP